MESIIRIIRIVLYIHAYSLQNSSPLSHIRQQPFPISQKRHKTIEGQQQQKNNTSDILSFPQSTRPYTTTNRKHSSTFVPIPGFSASRGICTCIVSQLPGTAQALAALVRSPLVCYIETTNPTTAKARPVSPPEAG